MFLPQEIIKNKRDNIPLTSEEINWFIKGVASHSIADAQISAFAMAVFFNKLSKEELVALTLAMRDSGEVLTWEDLDGPIVDKHSTGGVGDLISFPLAAIVVSCGGYVPMLAGRGLGHTGGTLDKLDSIPGYNTTPDLETFRKVVKGVGGAIIGQTAEIAPADKRMYSVRDITATTESLELITSSILSKKLAAGLQSLVMDVKTGNGAFLTEYEESIKLAESIASIGNGAGCKTTALITCMNQPITDAAGNAIEIVASMRYLEGQKVPKRLDEVVKTLAVHMLTSAGLASDEADAINKVNYALTSGKALETFGRMLAALGADRKILENYQQLLPKANFVKDVFPKEAGFLSRIDTKKLGLTLVILGGGRTKVDDKIDYSVGFTSIASLGERVDSNRPLLTVHAKSEEDYNRVAPIIQGIVEVTSDRSSVDLPSSPIYKIITPQSMQS